MRPRAASSPFLPPQRIGRYQVLLRIASGGMATVYLGRARGIGGFERDVAIKLSHGSDHGDFASDLIEEAKLASRLRHPNVVPVLDVGESPAGVFLVMDYVAGDSLAGLTRAARKLGEPLTQNVALRILFDAMSGLHAAHELLDETGAPLGLVHRDFTPQNILVGTDGVARLTDFGIAKATSRLARTRTGDVKGKARYMAPEQARGQPLDRRCDVWAAGVMAWEILAEQSLFAAENELAILLRITTDPIPRISEVRPELGTAFDAALASALTRNPDERCPSLLVFGQMLRAGCVRAGLSAADAGAVAAVVARLAGARLAERAERVAEVLAVQARMHEIDSELEVDERTESERPLPSPAALPVGALPVPLTLTSADNGEHTDATAVTDRVDLRRRRRLVSSALAAAVVVVLVAAVGWRALRATDGAPHRANAAPSQVAPSASADEPPAAATARAEEPSASATTAPAATAIAVFADAPIVELKIGSRVVVVHPPANAHVVERAADERDGSLSVTARTADGRTVSGSASLDTTILRLSFPPRTKNAGNASVPQLSPNPF